MNADKGKIGFSIELDNSKLKKQVDGTKKIFNGLNDSVKRDFGKIDGGFKSLNDSIRNEAEKTRGIFNGLITVGAGLFTFDKAKDFLQAIIKTRAEIESFQISLETMLGSKSKAEKMLGTLRDIAASTPMMVDDLARAAQTLLGFGVEQERIIPIIKTLGDISMGNAQRFNSLSLAFAQMSSAGKLMGQDLLQMINAGFNPLSVIAEQTGKKMSELRKEMEGGRISSQMVTDAFISATSEGGKFYRMLERQGEGMQGSVNQMKGAIVEMLNDIGTKMQDVSTSAILGITDMIKNYEQVGKVIAELVATYGVYKAALISINAVKSIAIQLNNGYTASEILQYKALVMVEKSQKALNRTMLNNPYVLAAAGIAALSLAAYKLATHQSDAEKATKQLNEVTKEYDKNIAAERVQIDSLFARLKAAKEGTDEYKSAKQAIINQYGNYLSGLQSEIQSLQDVEGAYKAVTEAAQDAARARAMDAASKQAADDYAEKEAQAKDEIRNALKDRFKDRKGKDGMSLADTYYWQLIGTLDGKTKVKDEFLKLFDVTHFVAGDAMHGIGGYTYTTNAITDAFEKIRQAQAIFEGTMAENRLRFGTNPIKAESGSENDPKIEIIKNKKYWEDYLKEQQGLLDAMTEAQLHSKEANDIRSLINQAKGKLSYYNVESTSPGIKTLSQMILEAESERKKVSLKASQERIALEKEMHFEQEQNRINLEQDAMKRKEMQMQLDNEKEIYNWEKQRDAAVQAEIERQKAVFDAAENEKKAKNKKYVEKNFTESDVDKDAVAKIYAQYQVSFGQIMDLQKKKEQEYEAEQSRTMNEYLAEYGSYLEKRNAIIALYEERISNAETQGEKNSLAAKMREELSALDMEANKTTSAVSKLFDDMRNKTVKDMRAIAAMGEEAFQFLLSGEWDEEKGIKLGISKETFETISKSPDELEKIRKAIKEITDAANASDNAFNKMANGLEKVFKAGNNTNQLNEGLELIESGLNDCLAVGGFLSDTLSSLGDAFGSGALSGMAEGLNVAMDAASSAMSGAKVGAMFGPIGAAVGGAIGLVSSLAGSFAKLHDKKHEKRIQKMQEQIEVLEKNYDKLARSIDKAFSKDASQLIQQQNTLLEQQKLLIQKQIKEEEDKKKTDHNRIKEWRNEIEEIDQLIQDNKEAAVDAIFGEDVSSAIEDFAESYAEAWASSGDKAESAKDTVKRMMRQMVTESIKAAIQSSGKMEEIRKKLQQFYSDNVLSGWEQDYIYNMAEQLQKQLDSQFGWADSLMTNPKEDEESEREGVKRGIATASQESVDENNARLTTIQGHTFGIKADTEAMRKEMAASNANMRELIDLSYTAVEHLAEISKNTAELYETNRRLKSVEESLDDINTRGVIIRN